jgi:uncharacterized membrane protein
MFKLLNKYEVNNNIVSLECIMGLKLNNMNVLKNILAAFFLMFAFIVIYIFSQEKNPDSSM